MLVGKGSKRPSRSEPTVTRSHLASWAIVAVVLAFFDSFATLVELTLGKAVEGNVLIAHAIERWGAGSALFVRGIVVSLLIGALAVLAARHRRAQSALRIATVVLALVAVYHVVGPALAGWTDVAAVAN